MTTAAVGEAASNYIRGKTGCKLLEVAQFFAKLYVGRVEQDLEQRLCSTCIIDHLHIDRSDATTWDSVARGDLVGEEYAVVARNWSLLCFAGCLPFK